MFAKQAGKNILPILFKKIIKKHFLLLEKFCYMYYSGSMDWISDGLTRMRNALMVGESKVKVRGTKNFLRVLDVMQKCGFVKEYTFEPTDELKQACIVHMAYKNSRPVIRSIKRVSKPSLRVYIEKDKIRRYLEKFSMPIISTSSGVMSGCDAANKGIGGEFICEVR